MTLKTKAFVVGAVTAGLLAAGAAQAGHRASLVAMKPGHPDGKVYPFVGNGPDFKAPVSDSASGNLNQTVVVDGWAFIDQTNCVQIGVPGIFNLPTGDPNGTWSSTQEQAVLGNGGCPGQMFTFSTVAFTWTNAHAAVGKTDTAKGVDKTVMIPLRYGIGRKGSIVDFVAFTYDGP